MIVGLACALMLGATVAHAEPVDEVEDLGQPLEDVLVLGSDWGPGPDGGEVLWSASVSTPAALNAIAPDGTLVASYNLPDAEGAWAVEVAPDGSVYVGTYGGSHVYRWTRDEGIQDLGNPLPDGDFVWTLDSDDEGVLYGGMSPNGKVFSYDPATGEYRDFGRLSDSDYVRSVVEEDGIIYAGTSRASHVYTIDAESGAAEMIPDPEGIDPEAEYVYDLGVHDGYLYARFGEATPTDLFVYDIEQAEWVDTIGLAHGLQVSAPDEDGRVWMIADGVLQSYDPASGELQPTDVPFTGRVANNRGIGVVELDEPDYPGESIVGMLWRGTMFKYNPTTGAYEFFESEVPGTPIPVTVLAEGVEGEIHAGGFFSGGFATIDAKSGEQESFHGFAQLESMATHGDRTYLGVYPDARLYEYDPQLEWHSEEYSPSTEADVRENPRQLVNLLDEDQVRAGAIASAGDYVALGTEPALDMYGGVFLLWDPEADEVAYQERGLIQDQSIIDLTYRDGVVYGATSIRGGYVATDPKAEEAVVFAFSIEDRELLWETVPVEGAETVAALEFDDSGRLWGTAGGQLFTVDVDTQQVEHRRGRGTAQQLAFNAADGLMYVDWGSSGLGWVDPDEGTSAVVDDRDPDALLVDEAGYVWFSDDSFLHRFPTVVRREDASPGLPDTGR